MRSARIASFVSGELPVLVSTIASLNAGIHADVELAIIVDGPGVLEAVQAADRVARVADGHV